MQNTEIIVINDNNLLENQQNSEIKDTIIHLRNKKHLER